MSTSTCCFVDAAGVACEQMAEWWIGADPMQHPDDYTEACTIHVGALLDDAYVHRIYKIVPSAEVSAHSAETSAGG